MKKRLFLVPLLLIFLFTSTPQPANAFACANCKQIWQGFLDYAFQAKELIVGGLTNANTLATTINTNLSWVNQTIFRPLQDAMMIASILKSSNAIKTLVLGSVGGEVSLLITNPEFYLKQQGVKALKVNVNYVSNATGVYSNNIIKSVVTGAREKSDPSGAIANCSRSSIPTIIQENLCYDDAKLEALAVNDVSVTTDMPTLAAIRDRKEELYSKLCEGDPSQDKALAKALTIAGDQSGIASNETWLAMTSGDNPEAKTRECLGIIASEAAAKVAAKADDLARGNGIVSKIECLKKSYDAKTGLDVCLDETILQTGYQLGESFKSAVNAPLDVVKNAFGTGGTFSVVGPLLQNISGIIGNINMMRNSIDSVNSSLNSPVGGIGGDPRLQITLKGTKEVGTLIPTGPVSTINKPIARGSYTQDLLGNSLGKNQLTKPIFDQLDLHTTALTSLQLSDADYLLLITKYSNLIEGVGSCYQQLIYDFPYLKLEAINSFPETIFQPLSQDPVVIESLSYYNSKKTDIGDLRSTILREVSLIGTTTDLVNTTRSTVTNSNSTEEIFDVFDFYTRTIETNKLPDAFSGNSRKSDMVTFNQKMEADIQDFTGMEGAEGQSGKIVVLNKQCKVIRDEEQLKRDTAIKAQNDARNTFGGGGN